MHIQTTHPKDTSCDIHIKSSPGSHEGGESGRAIGRVQAFSFVAFKVHTVRRSNYTAVDSLAAHLY